ncbi:SAP domain-containing protein [Perilla frutescens var. frutescens]|nr:SAP domain-containing protein [Perilla frutescens var. frutescens]
MDFPEEESHNESESDLQFSNDLQNDPNFDVFEETRLTLSNLSLKRKSKRPNVSGVKEMDDKEEVDELNEKDQKSYEIIQKMIEDGQVDRLKVEQCKIYLRRHGLRLSGKKDELIQRIKEHVDIVNGGGEEKYPASSFVLNCKGDSCKGDVVMFEQNVYEEFSIISRSASGGPCGTRIVAGRILKESYGAAKQQHTFTIEVLWSKGEKPLPPLHPLLIKGRNLYRLNTMRQRWEDEGERRRILLEKHARGGAARSNRDARIQQKEMRKMQRLPRNEQPNRKQEEGRREPLHSVSVKQDEVINHHQIQPVNFNYMQDAHAAALPAHQRQPLIAMNCNFQRVQHTGLRNVPLFKSPTRGGSFHEEPRLNYPQIPSHIEIPLQRHTYKENQGASYSQPSHDYHMQNINAGGNLPIRQQGYEHRQKCRYFDQGRCHFGDRCRYLH